MKKKLFVLVGPTAIGKTDISIELAKRLNGEVISADSMQVYKHMDIGTAKVTVPEMDNIPHHLIDIIDPTEEFTVSNYKDKAKKLIEEINHNNKLPFLVGGTGLYINSIVYNLNFAKVAPNEEIREKYENLANNNGNEYLQRKLFKVDPESSSRINVRDRRRLIRALEIYELTGKTMTEYNRNFRNENTDYDMAMVCLTMDRKQLYERINERVDLMIEQGLVHEVRRILDSGYSRDLVALKGIGYKEIIQYLEDEISLDDAIELIKKGSRNYAKRQLTWFRRDKRFQWFNLDEYSSKEDVVTSIKDYVEESLY